MYIVCVILKEIIEGFSTFTDDIEHSGPEYDDDDEKEVDDVIFALFHSIQLGGFSTFAGDVESSGWQYDEDNDEEVYDKDAPLVETVGEGEGKARHLNMYIYIN